MDIKILASEEHELYEGNFDVPEHVLNYLIVAKNHHVLSQLAHFNAKINEYYLTIDNLLAAVIVAKTGTLSKNDKNHTTKISRFIEFLGKKAESREIFESDLLLFFDLWMKNRYTVDFPDSTEIKKIRLFTDHLYDFIITELAIEFKSDKTILSKRINKNQELYSKRYSFRPT